MTAVIKVAVILLVQFLSLYSTKRQSKFFHWLQEVLLVWFYPYRSFIHSKWLRHKLGHAEYLVPTYYSLVLIL